MALPGKRLRGDGDGVRSGRLASVHSGIRLNLSNAFIHEKTGETGRRLAMIERSFP